MKAKTILLASLLVLGAVAVAPSASAGVVCEMFEYPPPGCTIGDAAVANVLCFYETAPRRWVNSCVL